MKLSENWLYEWVSPNLSREDLAEKLTMVGLEVESLKPISADFSDVVVGKVLDVEKHPDADKLKVCKIDVGSGDVLTIVCGASNVVKDLKVAVALVGALLPNNFKISKSKLRGVLSYGMLCASKELGICDETSGIMELAKNAPVGKDLREYLQLSDYVFDISITPNRGDCLSVYGISKEIAAIESINSKDIPGNKLETKINDILSVEIDIPNECPRYTGRIIKNIKADIETPVWMQEKLKRSGLRSVNVIVDIVNYVMLEIGQPMHAFDLDKISNKIKICLATKGDQITLLDGQTVTLNDTTMLVTDGENPLAIAGVMGGFDSSVTLLTKDIFLESAYFNPKSIASPVRDYKINSESSHRFERGVDPLLQVQALDRASELIIEITGGHLGPVVDESRDDYIPKPEKIKLRNSMIERMLGFVIPNETVESILKSLKFLFFANENGWEVLVPARRSDIKLEADLIEEVIRLYGYDNIPLKFSNKNLTINSSLKDSVSERKVREIFCRLGYNEVITYSFIDKKMQHYFDPYSKPKEIINPITVDMSVMRTNLWPGLVNCYLYNVHRQQIRSRIFEVGLRFVHDNNGELLQEKVVSGLVSNNLFPEQWGAEKKQVDFFDLKGDLEAFLNLISPYNSFVYKRVSHPALHPGQSAEIYCDDVCVGIVGAIHPSLKQELGITDSLLFFELLLSPLSESLPHKFQEISKFPEIRRDIAIFVDQSVPLQVIQDTISDVGGMLLRDVFLFDLYQGKGIVDHKKSIALALTLQHESRTLVDEEVTDIINNIISELKQRFAAELRG
ncbi:phenylalanine--tRNA ligase subunit beta [Gammaproteobacteria bacterium]|nr:phenylalanine--tRNA ligase subunit beta [Gammaproteobacteria bacterium]